MKQAAKELAREALRAALSVRRLGGRNKFEPICVYDLAERIGVEVRFLRASSFEGIFSKNPQAIVISSLRPSGRQVFTCAHELGHWFFAHGTCVDELDAADTSVSRQEKLANLFAAYLLMPPWAVRTAFQARKVSIETPTAIQVHAIAGQFGVGYDTLLVHLSQSLGTMSFAHAEALRRQTPKGLRTFLLNDEEVPHLVIVDSAWTGVPVDLRVGEAALYPEGWRVEGLSVQASKHREGVLVRALRPGLSRAESADSKNSTFIRIARPAFEGRSVYRHLEDPDYD